MRLGSTVLLAHQTCVQSYGWSYFRPLGALQTIVDELEGYECDEIAIVRPVRHQDTLEEFANDIDVLRTLRSMTPISFGGGIRSIEYVSMLEGLPIERLIFSSVFLGKDELLLNEVAKRFGRQSIQCCLPIVIQDSTACFYNCSTASLQPLKCLDASFVNAFANEVIVHDCSNEGKENAFDWRIVEQIGIDCSRLIISGGVGVNTVKQSLNKAIASVLVDNKTLHKEYSVAGYKHAANL